MGGRVLYTPTVDYDPCLICVVNRLALRPSLQRVRRGIAPRREADQLMKLTASSVVQTACAIMLAFRIAAS